MDQSRDQVRLLGRFGLGPEAEDVYLALVSRTTADAAELADATGCRMPRIHAALTTLTTHGLVQPLEDDRFRARSPELAFCDHLAQRQREVDEDRASVERLTDLYRKSAAVRDATEIVQVITGRDALAAAIRDFQEIARVEIRSLVKPPVLALPAAENQETQLRRMAQGVRYRSVYEQSMLAQGADIHMLEQSVSGGELFRMAAQVPVKMMMVDSTQAILPLSRGPHQEPIGVLVRHRSLLDVLDALFERVWEAAAPIPNWSEAGAVSTSESGEGNPTWPAPSDQQLLSLLVAGLPDRALATHLGVSKRTVERRVAKLLAQAGVGTRIQLGLHAAREGWI